MFERYTEKARRVIFFARYEASAVGADFIELPHLLLGLLRESRTLFLEAPHDVETIRAKIEAGLEKRAATSTSVDLPLNHECKTALAFGAEEAERVAHRHIGSEHLLLGIIRVDRAFVQHTVGFTDQQIDGLRERVARGTLGEGGSAGGGFAGVMGAYPMGAGLRQAGGMPPERQAVIHAVFQALLQPSVTVQITTVAGTQTFSFQPNPGAQPPTPEPPS